MAQLKKHIIVSLFLSITLMLTVNSALFWHTHQLSDGSIVVHAHPFSKTADGAPFKSHHHSKGSLMFLEVAKVLFQMTVAASLCLFLYFIRTLIRHSVLHPTQRQQQRASGRAPPIMQ